MGTAEEMSRWQRMVLKRTVKTARKNPGEPLSEEDWEAYFRFGAQPSTKLVKALFRALPSTPRCGFCGAPFGGLGSKVVGPMGYRPSRKNPSICSTCVELAPPGGMTLEIGVLFADLRGFTSESESRTPAETSAALRRFYAHAERTLLPEAIIDKLIGDEVMALYIPPFVVIGTTEPSDEARAQVARQMLDHARELLERIGYGSKDGPEFAVGMGLDYGEAFIGNIGDSAVHDFTAVGDVVNTASRLQGQAESGQVIISDRLARFLGDVGQEELVTLKGKQDPVAVRRVSWFGR